MRLRDDVIGALNLFRKREGPLPENEASIPRALADIATIGLLQERALREAKILAAQLQTALNNRVIIEQAKGVLAERRKVGLDVAFELLRTHARRHNLRVAELARAVVEGRLDAHAIGS